MRRASLSMIAALPMLMSIAACGGRQGASSTQLLVSFADDPHQIEFQPELQIPLEEGERFEFCPRSKTLDLNNAQWLAFLSGNEYSHFGHIGPLLERLGFGRHGEGRRWAECARDLYALRSFGESGAGLDMTPAHSEWGSCARDWARTAEERNSALPGSTLSGLFAHDLVRQTHSDWYIEFFSEGRIDEDGRFRSGSTQAMWARHGTLPIVIVVFRGTELRRGQRVPDVASDLDVRWVPFARPGWGRVHRGFQQSFHGVYEDLLERKLEELEGEDVAIWITGHSLGAALATVLAANVLASMQEGADLELAGLYTYGSPRVGDHDFAEAFRAATTRFDVAAFRFRNANDAVTRVPISLTTREGFEHVGQLVYFDREGHMILDPEHVSRGIRSAVSDHDISTYRERILHHAQIGGGSSQCR